MKTCDVVINKISGVFGEYPGSVDVSHHVDMGGGVRDGFENTRVALPSSVINADGSYNDEEIYKAVRAKIGETVEVED